MSQFDTAACECTPAPANTARVPAVKRWQRYLARHWRGEFGLPYTSIVNGLVLGAILLGTAHALGGPVALALEPAVVAVGLTTLWVAIALVALWQIVGVFRAADHHARAGHSGLAAGGAVVAVLLGVLVSVGVFVRGSLPHIVEASQFALGKDPIGDVALTISGESELELSGPIVFGVTKRVRATLDRHPAITTIRLNSPGGRVVEARDLRDLIKERGLVTVASGNCASACAVAFMAGRERLLAATGSLGFHRYRSPGLDESEVEASMAIDRKELGAHGVPAWFLDRAYTTPHSGMWRPSLAELKVANVVTGELTADGTPVLVRNDRQSIEAELLKSPLYATLKAHESEVYTQVVNAMEEGARSGMKIDGIGARTRPLITRLAAKYLPSASDEAVVGATAVAAETMRALQSQSADTCYRLIQPAGAPADMSAVPFELREREMAAAAAVIGSGAGGVVQPAGESTATDLQWVYGQVVAQFGEEARVLSRLGDADVDRAMACAVVATLYEKALSLPAPRNAQLLRFLLAGK